MNRACQRWEKVGQYFLRFLHGGAVSFLWEAIYVIIITARSTPCGGVAGFGLRCRCAACSSSVLRTLDAVCSAAHGGQALRYACAWLRASWLSAISGASRPSVCGSRTVGRPEFIRVVQFRPKGRNSLTTFRGQTALRGCPRARGVRCRIAPCRSLCSPPTLPAGRFGLRPRPHWGHASLRDSSLRSPARKKALIAHFDGGARNVARNLVG